MDTQIWGPSFWKSLHLLSLAYPESPSQVDLDSHKQYLYALARVLPCPICRQHFQSYLSEVDIDSILKNKDSFVRFLFSVHNDVNKRLNKKVWTYEQFYAHYNHILIGGGGSGGNSQESTSSSFTSFILDYLPTLIVVLLLGVIFYFVWAKDIFSTFGSRSPSSSSSIQNNEIKNPYSSIKTTSTPSISQVFQQSRIAPQALDGGSKVSRSRRSGRSWR
jgi:FAD-linked sulfhydryl oxidase